MLGQNWKGKVGALGVMLGALAALCADYQAGTLSVAHIMAGITVISGGLSAFGIRQAIGTVGPAA